MNPIHNSHIDMLQQARAHLIDANKGYESLIAIISPSSDQYVRTKPGGKGQGSPTFDQRLQMAMIATNVEKLNNKKSTYYEKASLLPFNDLIVSDWEGKQSQFVDFPEVIKHFKVQSS